MPTGKVGYELSSYKPKYFMCEKCYRTIYGYYSSTILFEKDFDKIDREATVYFAEDAYIRMLALVDQADKEIAWNGVARRLDKDSFIIEDILVYPQEVTGATVTVDPEEEFAWRETLSDDQFNNLRFQGHSHVNMGVTPSSTDMELYEDILSQIKGEDFYIFMIWNKKSDTFIVSLYF